MTLIVAGDIDDGKGGSTFIEDCCKRHKYVIVILGNHDYYHEEYHDVREYWRNIADSISNLYFLDPGVVELDGITFIGATLWTDLNKNDWFVKKRIQDGINDFRGFITVKNKWNGETRWFNPNDCVSIHDAELHFIKQTLLGCKGKKIVVISHHAPLPACSSEQFRGDPYNPYFFSNLEDVFRDYEFNIWIHGHVHSTVELKDIYGKDVLCNPKGSHKFMNGTFDPNKTFSL